MNILPILVALSFSGAAAIAAEVRIEAVPEGGVQPQVVVDAVGTAHLVYLKGEPKGSDVRYSRKAKGASTWSAPLTVNSEPRSAVAMGTIRGAQIALGQRGAVHVVWNGPMKRLGTGHRAPLFYTRLDPEDLKFAPQRDMLGDTAALDGGASVAADEQGNVYIVWHGQRPGDTSGESARVVFVLKSRDGGLTFGEPVVANADYPGVCACCSLKVIAAPKGELITLYRAAHTKRDRDMTLLTSLDAGATFSHAMLHLWQSATCPMSSAALLETTRGVRAAWETDGKIYSMLLNSGANSAVEIGSGKARHPALAINGRGETLAAWTIGTGWNRGGEVGWTILDSSGQPGTTRGTAPGVPVWSHAAAYAEADGSFVILR